MKSVVVRSWGEPQVFPIEEVTIPAPEADEVVVRVHTAAICFGDTLFATNRYQVKPLLPFTPGSECSGVVLAVGAGVEDYKPGDRVAALGFIGKSRETRSVLGSCREYTVVTGRNLLKIPDGVTLEQAALFRSNFETSYLGLQEGRLREGETLLVLGGGGGTGHAAISIAKMMGARVIASASSPEKRAISLEAGADHAVDSTAEDWRAQIEAIVGRTGVDVVYDPVGGAQTERAFRTLGYGGRLVVIGFAAGEIPRLPMNLPLMKASSVIGANMLVAWEQEPDRIAANARHLMGLLAAGQLAVPPIAHRFKLEEAGQAIHAVASGKVAGRVVVSVGGPDEWRS